MWWHLWQPSTPQENFDLYSFSMRSLNKQSKHNLCSLTNADLLSSGLCFNLSQAETFRSLLQGQYTLTIFFLSLPLLLFKIWLVELWLLFAVFLGSCFALREFPITECNRIEKWGYFIAEPTCEFNQVCASIKFIYCEF